MALWGDGISALLIDGKLSDGRAGTFPTVNPATEEVLGVAADADAEDMGRAIEAARRAFDSTDWSRNTELRVRCVRQLRDAMQQHVEELRELTISEVGAPRMLTASAQLEGPVGDLSFAADTAESYPWKQDLGEASPLGIATRRTLAREAVGVVGAITPWNFPHQINLAKLGPALAAGNTVVLKPAPDTPWCAAALGEIIVEHTDFPPGVVNIVTSSSHALGALLYPHRHPRRAGQEHGADHPAVADGYTGGSGGHVPVPAVGFGIVDHRADLQCRWRTDHPVMTGAGADAERGDEVGARPHKWEVPPSAGGGERRS